MGLAERLAGKRVLVTGATGFVGEALLERLLSDLPGTGVVVLIRPRAGRSGQARLAGLVAKPAFAPWRERLGADGVEQVLRERVTVLEGDLERIPAIPADVDTVVHCAGEVSFDPPIDTGFATNLGGVQELLRAIRDSGARPHVVHISTAYVAGLRSGHVAEGRLAHTVDWRAEQAAAQRARRAAEDASRAPETLRGFRAEAEGEHIRAGAQTVSREAERRRRRWVERRLVDAGGERARVLGWTDCYTFTKALAERYLETERDGLPLTIMRPSIIESALARPFPGWIEGFKMAEPLILAYGRGELPDFPASPDGIIDIIPVDLVVNAILAAAAAPPPASAPAYYTVCSGFRNPLLFRDLYENVREYFERHPLSKPGRGAVAAAHWRFAGAATVEGQLRRGERFAEIAGRALGYAPRSDRVRQAARDLEQFDERLSFLRRYQDLYRSYTKAELVYVDDATRRLHQALDAGDAERFGFDPACYDWRTYLQEIHFPSVTSTFRGPDKPPAPPRRASHALAGGPDTLAVFDLDGTLVSSTVVESYLWLRLTDQTFAARGRELAQLARALPGYVRAERRDRGHLIRAVYTRYAGADPGELARLVDEVAGDILLRRVKAGAIRRIREHRDAGHRTVLLTGAVEVLTRPLAPLFDEVVATRLAVGADGRCTGRLVSAPLVGDSRAAWLDHYAKRVGADLAASWAYADSQSDLPMLRAVGNPVAVNPDLPLYRVARRSGWPIEQWASTRGEPRAVVGSRHERTIHAAARARDLFGGGAAALSPGGRVRTSRPGVDR
ncbi:MULTISPECIES: HAD-IB family hydrolase [unclassified Frankia]|uniref:HAD-IB family hydrolase n=1 Tax=unclassified Frankia TaxID=2632575 RepID=UPI001EF5A066|nr:MULTISPECIES: HAD-IB family hydrolase [unclassified Frankia]